MEAQSDLVNSLLQTINDLETKLKEKDGAVAEARRKTEQAEAQLVGEL